MDFNVSAPNKTTTIHQELGGNEAIIAAIMLVPVLYCTSSYLYLLRGLIKKKIWKQIPFYACFIVLGISDCNILFRYITNQCLVKIFMVVMTPAALLILSKGTGVPSSDYVTLVHSWELMFTLIESTVLISYSFSACMLGLIAITRTLAITKPITYKQRWFASAGKTVITGCSVISLTTTIIPMLTIIDHGFYDSYNFEYIVVVPALFPVSASAINMVQLLCWVALPVFLGGVLPMLLYPFMAHKLRSATVDSLLNTSQKKIETRFFIIGLTLSLAFLCVAMMFIATVPFSAINSFWVQLLLNIAYAAEAILASINPFIYWTFDSTIRKEIPIPMWVPFIKKATHVVPVTAASAATKFAPPRLANPIQIITKVA